MSNTQTTLYLESKLEEYEEGDSETKAKVTKELLEYGFNINQLES